MCVMSCRARPAPAPVLTGAAHVEGPPMHRAQRTSPWLTAFVPHEVLTQPWGCAGALDIDAGLRVY